MSTDVLDSADVRLLNEIAMIGAGAGASVRSQTEQIFQGLMALRPERDFPYIGLASAHINQQRPDEAVRVLERGLRIMLTSEKQPPPTDLAMVKAFLGLALLMSRRTAEAVALLQTLLKDTQHPPAVRIARGLLGLPQEDIQTQESA